MVNVFKKDTFYLKRVNVIWLYLKDLQRKIRSCIVINKVVEDW